MLAKRMLTGVLPVSLVLVATTLGVSSPAAANWHVVVHDASCAADQHWSANGRWGATSGTVTLKAQHCYRADGWFDHAASGLCERVWLRWWDTRGTNTLVDRDITRWCSSGSFAAKPGDGTNRRYANWLTVWVEADSPA